MANYDIPQYPIKRLRYFNNQFLKDQDFIDDASYQIACERALLRSLCVAGVCEGLVVSYPATNQPPSVSAGIAIDGSGQMIVLGQPTAGIASPGVLADGDYFVHISFLESEDDKSTGQGAPDYTRWTQTPVITATAKTAALPAGAVVLGSCTVKTGVFVGSGTTIGRQYSGLRLPGPNQTTTAALRNTGASDDLAVLGGSLMVRRDAGGQLGPTLTLLNGAGAAGAGGAIDFNGSDPGGNDPSLRLRSLDDGNSSSHLTFATKQPGASANHLVERLRLTSNGLLQFSSDSPKDKLVISDDGAGNRYGIGLNDANINLFCPTSARFSLRQNSNSGTEVFTVDGAAGNLTMIGDLTMRKRLLQLGSTDDSPTVANEIVGGIGFRGYGQSNGELAYRTGQGFEFVDTSKDGPRVPYSVGDYPYATVWCGGLHVTNGSRFSGDRHWFTDVEGTNRVRVGTAWGIAGIYSEDNADIVVGCPSGKTVHLGQPNTVTVQNGNLTASGDIAAHGYWLTVKGGGNEQCYIGGDGYGNDVQIGSMRSDSTTVVAYNATTQSYMDFFCRSSHVTSDERSKDNIEPILGALERVVRLCGVSFDWKMDHRPEGSPKHLGLVAQQVREVVPEAVMDGKGGLLSIAYNAITALLIEAVKEQQKQLDELRTAMTPTPA